MLCLLSAKDDPFTSKLLHHGGCSNTIMDMRLATWVGHPVKEVD